MRATLDIADDVLLAAKELARRKGRSLGQVISELSRRSFAQGWAQPAGTGAGTLAVAEPMAPFGIQQLPARGGIVTNELIDRLREQEGL